VARAFASAVRSSCGTAEITVKVLDELPDVFSFRSIGAKQGRAARKAPGLGPTLVLLSRGKGKHVLTALDHHRSVRTLHHFPDPLQDGGKGGLVVVLALEGHPGIPANLSIC
jgi:hypothetical protein